MAAYTSTGSGNWTDNIWGGGYPVDGDTATISTGHVIATAGNVTIGNSPAGETTVVLQINGELNHTSGTLTIKGACDLTATTGTNGRLTMSAGTHLVIDGKYRMRIGTSTSQVTLLRINGTAENRCTVSSTGSGSTNGYIDYHGVGGTGLVQATYCDFTRIGDATNACIRSYGTTSSHTFSLVNCTFTACGQVTNGVAYANATNWTVENCQWFSTVSTSCVTISFNATFTSGIRRFVNNRGDKLFTFNGCTGLTTDENLMRGGRSWLSGSTVFAGSWRYNLIDATTDRNEVMPSSGANYGTYWYAEGTNTNVHPSGVGSIPTVDLDSHVFDFDSSTDGDMVIGGTSGQSVTIRNCLVLLNSAGTDAGVLCSPVSGMGSWDANHNTVMSTDLPSSNSGSGVARIGETTPGIATLYAALKSNLVYSPSGQGAIFVGGNQNSRETQDGSNFTHNAMNAPVTAVGSGVVAVYAPGYIDTVPANVTVRVPSAPSGNITLLVYHSDGVTTAETSAIAWNATGSTVASAVQTALNTLSDGTYACTAVDASAPNSSTGARMTITRNSVAISTERVLSIVRAGGTNTTGVTLYVSRPVVSGTPGVDDLLSEDPEFVDATRNLATFDTAYLGNVAPAAWANGVSYSVGDIVSTSSAGFYGNATINFACRAAHTSVSGNATTGQPGVATNWRTNWEYASIYRIHRSVATYNANTPQATPRDLWTWVRAGFAPTNTAYREAGHDGEDIGAIAGVYASDATAAAWSVSTRLPYQSSSYSFDTRGSR